LKHEPSFPERQEILLAGKKREDERIIEQETTEATEKGVQAGMSISSISHYQLFEFLS
jgi:hypothetical protein